MTLPRSRPRWRAAIPAVLAVLAACTATAAVTAPAARADPPGSGNCKLIVPADPLTAAGLATPYRLVADAGCAEAGAGTGAFVQAAIIGPDGAPAVYDPLVTDVNKAPAAAPVVPVIPAGSVVAIWTGFDGNVLTLQGPGAGAFTQGAAGSPFGQVAYANAPAFFAAAAARHTPVPPLGTGKDGKPCPTVRDFTLADQDPSDNVTTKYLATASGQTAQDTAANAAALPGAAVIRNPSDNGLVDSFIDPALGCTPFTAPDLADPGHSVTAQGLNELLAMANPSPDGVALVPPNDPMTTVGAGGSPATAANLSAEKTNAYRAGVGQPAVTGDLTAEARGFCDHLAVLATARLALDAPFETGPQPIVPGLTLNEFMKQRLTASLANLNCPLFGTPAASGPAPAPAASSPAPVPAAPAATPSPPLVPAAPAPATAAVTTALRTPDAASGGSAAGNAALNWAEKNAAGVPYAWGGTGPSGYDCSGLVMTAFARGARITLPRTTYAMLGSPRLRGVPLSQAQRGDLLFFGAGHVEFSTGLPHGSFGAQKRGTAVGWHQWGGGWVPTAAFRVSWPASASRES
jgi:cell wall-associated NlpC family hydrolase